MRRTIVLLALLLPSPLLGQSPVHPLDGLSLAEHWILYETLRGSGRMSDDAQFVQDLGMDSMMALEILASLEKKYKIIIPEEDLLKFTTLNNTAEVVSNIVNA